MKLFLLLFLFMSCSVTGVKGRSGEKKSLTSQDYTLTDFSGEYLYRRDVKKLSRKLITRVKIFSKEGYHELESLVSVSKIGTVKGAAGKNKTALIPEVSQFKVWFEKKEYFSQLKINRKEKKIEVLTRGSSLEPEKIKTYKVPHGKFFCFFSQIPECVKLQNLLLLSARKSVKLYIVWDNFPYHNEQYEGLGKGPLTLATMSLSSHSVNDLRYSLDLGNQVIFYHFDKDLSFKKMNWVSQGISLKTREELK